MADLTLLEPPAEALGDAFEAFVEHLGVREPNELVLINPPLVPEDAFDPQVARNKGYYAYPPVGLLYIAAVARALKPTIDIRVVDLNYELLKLAQTESDTAGFWKAQLKEIIDSCSAPHIGVTCMFGATKTPFLEISSWVRAHYPEIPVLVGGVQATYDACELLERNTCDVVFKKEAELEYRRFLAYCMGEETTLPQSIAFRAGDAVYETPDAVEEAPVEWDIRELYDLIEIEKYHLVGSLAAFSRYNGADKPFATVLTNRGCRARCTFCTVRDFNGFGVRQRPVDCVVEEIKYLVEEKGIRQIDWLDDDLLWNPKRTVELFKRLAEEVPDLEWICNNGLIAAAIDDEIMHWMVESGLKAFKIGIETGNEQMLHAVKKPTTKPKLREGRERYRKYPDVFVSANFIVGMPNETFEQMLDSYLFANELEWDWSSFYICQPLKGTEMFSAFQELGDDRCEVESYDKTLNPGRGAARGEFGYGFDGDDQEILSGERVFDIAKDHVPTQDQIKEIWFTFNLKTNFLNNPNFAPGGNPIKIVKWLESIAHAYPYDASMIAALIKGYRLLDRPDRVSQLQSKFKSILADSDYWQRRVREFPGLLELADVSSVPHT